jgi:hypothetical protein
MLLALCQRLMNVAVIHHATPAHKGNAESVNPGTSVSIRDSYLPSFNIGSRSQYVKPPHVVKGTWLDSCETSCCALRICMRVLCVKFDVSALG